MRGLKFVGLLLVFRAVTSGLQQLQLYAVTNGADSTGASVVRILVLVALFALIAEQVGDRWFAGFVLLVPFVGLVFVVRWLWRLASLSDRHWETPAPAYLSPEATAR